MIKKIIRKIADHFGFQIIGKAKGGAENPFLRYDYEVPGREAINLVKNNTMVPPINLLTLYEQAVYCEKKEIEGDFVECGVWKGGSVGIMAKANMDFGKTRRQLHLFDAFDDICPPNAKVDGKRAIEDMQTYGKVNDESELQGQLTSVKGFYDSFGGHGSIQICKQLLEKDIQYPNEYIHFHKGWFQDTLPTDAKEINKIAILRLDGDWYDSTKICLEHLYDKVVPGGVIVIDDYGFYEGCAKAVNEFLDKNNIKTFLSYSNPWCRYFIKN